MRRIITVFLIAFICLFLSGCMKHMHGITHPHSDITAPTFCLYDGHWNDQKSKPVAISRILIYRAGKINDERFDWETERPYSDQDTWEMEYDPDGKSDPPSKPLSCLTYGKVPPDYIESIPAQPLIPERVYTVRLQPQGGMPMSWGYFVIRADSQGRPTHLEYNMSPGPDDIFVITRQ